MQNSKKFLVAIPVFNSKNTIKVTIESCLNQTKIPEIVIIDNKSQDGTYEYLIQEYGENENITLYQNNKNYGRIGNWNRCLEIFSNSRSEYIKFLFSGDEIYPTFIEESEKVVNRYPDIAAIASGYQFISNGKPRVSIEKLSGYLDKKQVLDLNMREGGFLGAIVTNVYSKQAIRDYRFSEFFVGKLDFDFFVLNDHSAYYIHKVLAKFNLKSRNTYHNALDYWMDVEVLFNRIFWLEKNKKKFEKDYYNKIKFSIITNFIIKITSSFHLFDIVYLVFKVLKLKISKTLKFDIIMFELGEWRDKHKYESN